jgi:ABC-type uncharacterized transport system permease subunit
LAGALGGAIMGFIPAILKIKLMVNELISAVMLNYIVQYFFVYLIQGPMRDQSAGIPHSPQLPHSTWLPILVPRTRFHAGIILAVLIAVALSYVINRTVLGFQIRAVGENTRAARVAGIPPGRTIILAMLISGAVAGLAGGVEICGVQHRLIANFSPGYGLLGLAVALLVNLEPIGNIFSALIFGALLNGADAMQSAAGVPLYIVIVIQGLVIVLVAIQIISRR